MKFFNVPGCRGLHDHGQPWVSLSGDVLTECLTDFHFHGCWVRYAYLHPYSKDLVSHLVGGFFLTPDPLGNLFFVTFSCSAAQLIVHSDGLLCELALQKRCNNFFRILPVFRIICLGVFWVEKKQCVCNMVDVPRIWKTQCAFSTHPVMPSIQVFWYIWVYQVCINRSEPAKTGRQENLQKANCATVYVDSGNI